MKVLTRMRTVLVQAEHQGPSESEGPVFVRFAHVPEDGLAPRVEVLVTIEDFKDLGQPEQVTVTIEPGDQLNEKGEDQWSAEAMASDYAEDHGGRKDPLTYTEAAYDPDAK